MGMGHDGGYAEYVLVPTARHVLPLGDLDPADVGPLDDAALTPYHPIRASVADLGPDSIVFELAGAPEEIDSFEELLRPHGVKELVRTGRVGLSRASSKSTIRRRQLVVR